MGVLTRWRGRLAGLRDAAGGDSDEPAAVPAREAARRPSPPDPAKPPAKRGTWEEAALTNVDVTEVVKRQIRTVTRPWNK